MKKNIFIILFFTLITGNLFAAFVDTETAKSVGQAFIAQNNTANAKSLRSAENLTLVYTAKETASKTRTTNDALFYVFNADNSFVIVSGDDATEPILAYSNDNLFDAQNINPALKYWLNGYELQIIQIRDKELSANEEISEKWNNLLQGKSIRAGGGKGPLVSAKWDQSQYYNAQCPVVNNAPEGYGGRVPVGCVAVAMGQVMNYWKYPLRGTSSHSYKSNFGQLSADFGNTVYEWSIIPDSLKYEGNNIPEEQNELAKLLFHLGVSVEMQYSAEGSGAYTFFKPNYKYPSKYSAETAMETFFGYDKSMAGIEKKDYSDNDWLALIKKEIDEGRPVIYGGIDSTNVKSVSAHAFVCDGYDDNGKAHFNWGWGGYGNGFFLVSDLYYTLGNYSYNWNSGQEMLIGIQPPYKFQPFDIRLDNAEIEENIISYGEQVKITTDISNRGANAFNGKFCVIFYDGNAESVDFAVVSDTVISSDDNANFNFAGNSLRNLKAGEYYAEVYYAVSGGNWLKFNDYDSIKITINENDETPINKTTKSGKYGLRFAQNIVSEKAEIYVGLPEQEKISETKITIYDNIGNLVFNSRGVLNTPYNKIVWDLRNSAGRFVANGTYLVIAEVKNLNGITYIYSTKLGVKR